MTRLHKFTLDIICVLFLISFFGGIAAGVIGGFVGIMSAQADYQPPPAAERGR